MGVQNDMKFVIRDDDLNYFSKASDIEGWYHDIFSQHIPVGFSTIPCINPTKDAYQIKANTEDKEYPIRENTELITYIKNNPLIEILQHGTTHETVGGVYEYQQKTATLVTETLRGKEELEKAFGDQFKHIFVPPHDWIGSDGVRAVESAHMNIIRGRGAGLRNWIPRLAYIKIFFTMFAFKLFHGWRGGVPACPYVLDFGLHKEVCSYRLEDTDVFDGLAYAHKKGGVFVVVTHLHFYTDEKKRLLLELIKQAEAYGAEFVPPSTLFL
jgi:hypothetical protein